MSRPKGSLGAQLQPRVVLMVVVMAILVSAATLVAARSILYGQLDAELDAAQVRQGRVADAGEGRVPGIEAPGMSLGTVMAMRLPEGAELGSVVGDGAYEAISTADGQTLLAVPVDGNKHSLRLPDLGSYRVEARDTRLGTLVIGLPTGDINRSLLWLALFASGISLVAISATSLVTRTVIDRATAPLVALTETADAVSRLNLERGALPLPRVDGPVLPENNEVTRLADSFNQMLGHVGQSLAARQASEEKLRRFVADASHELRNPLAAIRGYAELAGRAPSGEDASFAMQRIDAESERMTKLVGDLLLLARLDSDTRPEPRPVDVVEVALNAVSDAQAASRDHQWRLNLPDVPLEAMADPDRLHQVVVNLLSNARTHTPAGTAVTTSVWRSSDGVTIEVADDGPGIPPDVAPRVFERFARADGSRAHSSAHSTGLGLAIVKAVVESLGGAAAVRSRPGDTRFRVTLPAADRPGA